MTKKPYQIRIDQSLLDYLQQTSKDNYCTVSEYLRRLIVEDMLKNKKDPT